MWCREVTATRLMCDVTFGERPSTVDATSCCCTLVGIKQVVTAAWKVMSGNRRGSDGEQA